MTTPKGFSSDVIGEDAQKKRRASYSERILKGVIGHRRQPWAWSVY